MHYIASNACWCNLMHAKIIKCVVGKFQNHQTRNSLFFGSIWKCWFVGFVCIVMHSCHTACSTKTFSILPHLHWHILLDGKSSSEWTREGKRYTERERKRDRGRGIKGVWGEKERKRGSEHWASIWLRENIQFRRNFFSLSLSLALSLIRSFSIRCKSTVYMTVYNMIKADKCIS